MSISTIFYNFARAYLLKTRNPQFTQETVSLHIDFYSNYCTLYRREEKILYCSVCKRRNLQHQAVGTYVCVNNLHFHNTILRWGGISVLIDRYEAIKWSSAENVTCISLLSSDVDEYPGYQYMHHIVIKILVNDINKLQEESAGSASEFITTEIFDFFEVASSKINFEQVDNFWICSNAEKPNQVCD